MTANQKFWTVWSIGAGGLNLAWWGLYGNTINLIAGLVCLILVSLVVAAKA